MTLYTIGFEMEALSPSDLSPEAQRAKGEGTRRIEGAADARPQAEVDTESRRGFLRNVFAGAGAGGAMAYAYGRPAEAAASELPELAADDPNAPEEVSTLLTEGNLDRLQLAEHVADLIESGAITPAYAEETHEALAATGVLAVAATGEEPRRTNMSRRGLIAGLLGGTILVSAPEFARAQELAFVTYNINSNERSRGEYSGEELAKLEMARRRHITLEEFTRMPECESPRGARLFAQYEALRKYNAEILEKRKRGEKTSELVPVPIWPYWYRKPSETGSRMQYSFFRLKDQVLVPNGRGEHEKVYKHYGVAQGLQMQTREPHYLVWSGYLGTDKEKAQEAMEKARQNY